MLEVGLERRGKESFFAFVLFLFSFSLCLPLIYSYQEYSLVVEGFTSSPLKSAKSAPLMSLFLQPL
jgi:hypothetical protein